MVIHFGTRFLTILLLRAIAEYGRHKVSIDTDLSPGLKACLTELITFVTELKALDIAGPL